MLHFSSCSSSFLRATSRAGLLFASVWVVCGCSAQLGDSGPGDEGNDDSGGFESFADIPLETPLVRRLTRDEIKYTLNDGVGLSLVDEDLEAIPEDRPLEGFVNVATSQTVLPEHALGYSDLGELVAERVNWEQMFSSYGTCTEQTTECWTGFVEGLGGVLFRGRTAPEATRAFVGLFATIAEEEPADFELGARAVLRAMIQSPHFLYRIENETAEAGGAPAGSEVQVTGQEMAVRLSYLLWGSAPDQELMAAAEAGTLDRTEGVLGQVDRMLLEEDKARRVTSRYISDWGRLAALPDDGGLRAELVESLVATYDDMIWEQDASLLDLFTAQRFLLTGSLAENYGLVPVADGLEVYDVSKLDGRIGLLTHPGLLAGMTNADGGAIVARGLFLQSQLFCQETPSPPVAIQDAIDAFVEALPPDASDRYVAETRLERSECGSCHGGFDPLAYGLEQFDYQGRYRVEDEFGNTMTTDGWIPSRVRAQGEDLPYDTVEEYAALLAEEPAVQSCLTEQHFKYALGRVLEKTHAPLVDEVYREFVAGGGTYPAMMRAIAVHDLFRKMTLE